MSESNEELLCVSWKDFRQNFEKSLRDQVRAENISDVTLVSEDGHQFPAQKAVLAASSQFLAEILKNDPALDLVFIGVNTISQFLCFLIIPYNLPNAYTQHDD